MDPVAHPHRARRNLSRIATELVVRPRHELYGKTEGKCGRVARDLHLFEELQQTRALEPRRSFAGRDDVVALQRADRDGVEPGAAQDILELVPDALEYVAI